MRITESQLRSLIKAYFKDDASTIDRLRALGKWYTYDEVY